jgi:GNAT superfamily N-acetyltransferase
MQLPAGPRTRIFAGMSRLQVRRFELTDVPDAGALLAQRHRRHRLVQPLLSARYENAEVASAEVSAAFANDNASGAVAVRDGSVIGYLLGAPRPGEAWGPNLWIEAAGLAVAEAEVIRDLYCLAATRWVDEGRTAHYAIVPAVDQDLVRAWFRLAFGQQHVHGIREARATDAPAAGVTTRRATHADVPVLAELDRELPLHQSLAPTFSPIKPATIDESLAEWAADIDNTEYATFVAERDGQVIGSAVGCALERSRAHRGLARPDNAGFLSFAAVFPHARGAGAGRALGAAVLAWAAQTGFDCVVTDWRATNLLSSRTWPALGFAESFVRLHRLIGY